MTLLMILYWVLFGGLVGGLATFLYPGKQNLGCGGTIGLGVIGSFAGGFVSYVLGMANSPLTKSGLFMSIIGAVVSIFIWQHRNNIKNGMIGLWERINGGK